MDKDILVAEYLKIYFSCHPEELPKDPQAAFDLMSKLHKKGPQCFCNYFGPLFNCLDHWGVNAQNRLR